MLSSLLSPLRSGILLALVVVLLWRWLPRGLRLLASALLLLGAVLTTPWAGNALVGLQEARAWDAAPCAAQPDTIVVLGGGMRSATEDANDWSVLTHASLSRLFAAERLWREHPSAQMVISGTGRHAISESALMASLARQLGVPAEQIRVEESSRTTWQNAQLSAALMPPLPRHIWLLTSALHMPRARYSFEQAGFDVCAVPAESLHATAAGIGYFLPETSGLAKSDAAIRELVGELAYRNGLLHGLERDPVGGAGER